MLALVVPVVVTLNATSDDGSARAVDGRGATRHRGLDQELPVLAGPIIVDAGAELTVTNDDGTVHTLTADDGSFDTGDLDGGAAGDDHGRGTRARTRTTATSTTT